ncbi:MAG: C40 family peptidase, partial [Desulfobacterota bacterium]|nr:C40 family peptidase [Thermodesulfobacteriota bacterium]
MDLFSSFGILMPRNSNLQAMMGVSLGEVAGKSVSEKKRILDRAPPLATLLYMPGHIMLYLGKHDGKHYAIHSIRGIQIKGKSGFETKRIGKVAVTDLDLGKEDPYGSLIERLTTIRLFGSQ